MCGQIEGGAVVDGSEVVDAALAAWLDRAERSRRCDYRERVGKTAFSYPQIMWHCPAKSPSLWAWTGLWIWNDRLGLGAFGWIRRLRPLTAAARG